VSKKKYNLIVHDYVAMENTRKKFGKSLVYENNPLKVVRKSQLVFVVTSWAGYRKISDEMFEKNLSKGSMVIDTRSIYKSRRSKKWRVRVGYKN
jgi:UDP-glucose 6-dehydrogenase